MTTAELSHYLSVIGSRELTEDVIINLYKRVQELDEENKALKNKVKSLSISNTILQMRIDLLSVDTKN